MAYNKHTWVTQELVTPEKLNNLEIGVAENQGNGSSYQIISVDNNSIFDLDKVNYTTGENNYHNVVMIDSDAYMYSDLIEISTNTKLSFSAYSLHLNSLPGVNGSYLILQFFTSGKKYISQKTTKLTTNQDWTLEKIENITPPANSAYVVVKFGSIRGETSNILKVSRPMLNTGSNALPFSNDATNLIKNPTFAQGLSGWTQIFNSDIKPNMFSTFLEVEPEINNYRIETSSAVRGTLPEGLGAGSLGGAFLAVRGSSVNGIGGVTQSLEAQGKIYQRTFSYRWSKWQVVNGVYGSFDNTGVWHSVYGDPVVGGVVYNPQDDNFYALDLNGKTINSVGYVTAPVGKNNKEQIIKVKDGGVVDFDMSDSNESNEYVETVNNHLSNINNPTIQMIVTDTHGTSSRAMLKNFNKIFTGYQFNNLVDDGTLTPNPNTNYVTREDARITHSSDKYYNTIARKYANDSSRNIKLISDKFDVKPILYSNLGDVEDGVNYNVYEERISYDEASSVMRDQGFKFIDGNHDEQIYYPESRMVNKDGVSVVYPTSEHGFYRRVDLDRYKESYNEDSLYFSIKDDAHKIKYIYLDTFEGGRLKNKKGFTPDYGVNVGQSKLSANQIKWLISELQKLPDDWFVVINSHNVPDPTLIGEIPTGSNKDSWWKTNVNPDILAGVLIAFQTGDEYKGKSNIVGLDSYDYSAYNVSVDVDFRNKPTNRIIVWNYGHHHGYGHKSIAENGYFNIIQHRNLLDASWSYIGHPSGSQFSTQIIDTENRKVTNIRFGANSNQDADFTLDF